MGKTVGLVTPEGRECTSCAIFKLWSEYCIGSSARGHAAMCRECRNTQQQAYRTKVGRAKDRRYEKTKKGFLMRLYRNMQSRVTGVQRAKWHLYAGIKLLPREMFYKWAENSIEFHRLFALWEVQGHPMKQTPSVDRVDSFYGYEIWNMEWVTHSENSRRATTRSIRGCSYAA